ncbi:MAG: phage tail protein [Epsilonproteobacteria bacterium]|nr:phage tail protein [Campylobacterota bacterium]OIO13868.1 MAG: hypothetical protein AUJ81_10600 [Helicobacteraceae bacterium CG1_02_36_14]PIP11506.1 MAG: hypothetical protein COX50_00275 [Sulfurimonas sp. CG23_combo_of_CG06-09_8_20_14_all_36_33]PIS24989.1 MAG: hypothetical protein COT46_07565 [Sulfurimonas sp. CG08_land_8_20_14_0_20_36_33]PIU34867.1 MAG: hypothetical protein COT05_05870 [Sulfurimonas sp. CG07_land_8_20_14_0_80_36_56]PIV04529.1 MAG: hypothetical protein COS56_04550 [Sulfurim
MAEPFLGEIRIFGCNCAPKGWAMCDGTTMEISKNQALYALLSTQFGGNGITTFNLPDLRGRVPVHIGNGYFSGQYGGVEEVTLDASELASHTHLLEASAEDGTSAIARGGESLLANDPDGNKLFGAASSLVATNEANVSSSSNGGPIAHNNMQPSSVMNFCIALEGLFPSRN